MRKEVFHTLGMIDDDLIAEAGNAVKKVRQIRIKKNVAIAAAAVMLAGVTAFAATVILSGRGGHSYNIPSYYSVPNAETLQTDIGFVPNIPNAFSNGYCFVSGHITENEDYAEDGSVFEKYRGISCVYKNDQKDISLHADTASAGIQLQKADKTETYKGCQLKYLAYTNKLVPPDYKLTEQDKADKKSGKFVFSYGSHQVQITEVQLLAWQYNGVNYELHSADSDLTFEDFVKIAQEIIDAPTE